MKRVLLAALLVFASLSVWVPAVANDGDTEIQGFQKIASHNAPGGVAEIVSGTPDGNTLVYVDSGAGEVGVVDITDARNPQQVATVPVGGEPTSVSVSPDGVWAFVGVNTSYKEEGEAPEITPGNLAVIDIATGELVAEVPIGDGPDSVASAVINGELVVVVAIENEPAVVDEAGLLTDADEPGVAGDISGPGYVQIVTIDEASLADSVVTDVVLPESVLAEAGLYFANDPQPEFVDINNGIAAVSLQENNGIAFIDVAAGELDSVFSTGIVDDRPADLTEDAAISFTETYPADVADEPYAGARFPDGIGWSADGSLIYSADEGEFDYTGGRGWSVWTPDGRLVWDSSNSLEEQAVIHSHYPDSRSEAKGIEVEGIEVGVFDGREFVFAGAERGSFVGVYERRGGHDLSFIQLLPAGSEPEGLLALPQRGLFVTSDEATGTLTIFEATAGDTATADRPHLHAPDASQPWAAISGLASSAYNSRLLYAVPDNALPSAIYRVYNQAPGDALVTTHTTVKKGGEQARYDLEGIAVDTSIARSGFYGFWLASEGNAAYGEDDYQPNMLVQVNNSGEVLQEVMLPAEVDSPAGGMIRSNGFEGVAVSDDGRYLLAAIQREYADDDSADGGNYARIARYDLETGAWEFFLYPLASTDVEGDWIGLSEITNIGGGRYAVIERDKMVGAKAHLKHVTTFTLNGVAPWDGLVTADADLSGHVIDKQLLTDVLDEFAPFEKVEGLTVSVDGSLWAALDNDGGELESRLSNLGSLATLLEEAQNPQESDLVEVQLLAVNDLHGQLPTGRVLNDRPIGGAAYLAAYIDQLTAENPANTLLVHAGDMVGASPPESALLQDEPAIDVINQMGFDVGAVGNHEFDEGVDELIRLLNGGCHPVTEPVTGCFAGAAFPYLAANVVWNDSGEPILPPTATLTVDGVELGFIGLVTSDTPNLVAPSGIEQVSFLDEVEVINQYTEELVASGIEAIIVLIHEGGELQDGAMTGAIVDIATNISDDVDVIVSGHTHQGYVATIDGKLVTQSWSYSAAVADIDLVIDRETGDVVEKSATIIDTYNDTIEPNAAIAQLVEEYSDLAGPLLNRHVGTAAEDITREQNEAGESALGNLIADAQRWKMGTDFAFMNPGGIRDDILAGEVTWRELFTVQPFGNDMTTMDLTGAQVYTLLNQQWQGDRTRFLQISGVEYDYDPTLPDGARIVEVRQVLDDGTTQVVPNDDSTTYSVAVNAFLAGGGDNFTVLTEGANRVVGPVDLDALVEFVEQLPQPFDAAIEGRITVGAAQ
jgi:2',3'-cyclic-nucleotide 2'-phosphodiesterase (5'-nucleotidase family)